MTRRLSESTLEQLVDFDRINSREMRFSVGAVNVATGNFVYFDNRTHEIRPEHIMASGALPPGFPAIEIEGEHYWDGGLVSNTPRAVGARMRRPAGHAGFPGRSLERPWSGAAHDCGSDHPPEGNPILEPHPRQLQPGPQGAEAPLRSRRADLETAGGTRRAPRNMHCFSPKSDRNVYSLIQLIYRSRPTKKVRGILNFPREAWRIIGARGRLRYDPHAAASGSPRAAGKRRRRLYVRRCHRWAAVMSSAQG